MGAYEITRAMGISRSRAYELMKRKGFPDPLDPTLKVGNVWYEDEVMAWIKAWKKDLAEDPEG